MTRPIDRRLSLGLLAGAGPWLAAGAGAQDSPPAPSPTTPPIPPVAPADPMAPSKPAQPGPAPEPAIDNTKSYYVFFNQTIDVSSMRNLRRELAKLVDAGVGDITLAMDSAGGMIEPMLVAYSFIRALPAKVSTHAQGFVQSAATILFLAGQGRTADRNARFLFHPSQSAVTGLLGEQQLRDRLTAFGSFDEMTGQILRDRTSLSAREIERFTRETVIYDAEQARAAGVVQAVADLKMPQGTSKIMFLE